MNYREKWYQFWRKKSPRQLWKEEITWIKEEKEESIVKNEKGFIEVLAALFVISVVVGLFLAMFTVRFKASNEVVSGIAYNTTNDSLLSGNTHFSVRAGENTYVSLENESSYCLPPNSPYKELVNKAAQDKRIKIVVTAKKYFAIQAPWTCKNNVSVTEVKQ